MAALYITKSDILKEIKGWDLNSLSELAEEVSTLIKENSITVEIELEFDSFKGSGDCTIARVDKDTRKILEYIAPDRVVRNGKYKGKKSWILTDGHYQTCEAGNKAQDRKSYICVTAGTIESL